MQCINQAVQRLDVKVTPLTSSLNNAHVKFVIDQRTPLLTSGITNQQALISRVNSIMIAIDNTREFTISVLDVMHMMRQAWLLVTQATMANCFKHSNFVKAVDHTTQAIDEEEDPDDDLPLSHFARLNEINSRACHR